LKGNKLSAWQYFHKMSPSEPSTKSTTDLPVPFSSSSELNSEPLEPPLIPGRYTPLTTSRSFILQSLDQSKANVIFGYLWYAGPAGRFRSLHEQKALHRKIIPSEDPSLHQIWHNDIVWIKPLPPCLTNFEFVQGFVCPDRKMYELVCGFLFSYTHLICYASDHKIAIENGLIAEHVTWRAWQTFRLELLSFFDQHESLIDKRYQYGDLRLSRLNTVYTFRHLRWAGYHNVYTQYGHFFSAWIAAAVLVFAFASVTLQAMQVAIQEPFAAIPDMLALASYRFSIGIIITVACVIVILLIIFTRMALADLHKGLYANVKLARKLAKKRQTV